MVGIEWVILIIAGLLEPCWVIALEKCERFKNIKWTLALIIFMAVSLYLLSVSMRAIPVGTAYAVWSGIGAIGTLIAGIVLYKEPVTYVRMVLIVLLIVGIVGIHKFQ